MNFGAGRCRDGSSAVTRGVLPGVRRVERRRTRRVSESRRPADARGRRPLPDAAREDASLRSLRAAHRRLANRDGDDAELSVTAASVSRRSSHACFFHNFGVHARKTHVTSFRRLLARDVGSAGLAMTVLRGDSVKMEREGRINSAPRRCGASSGCTRRSNARAPPHPPALTLARSTAISASCCAAGRGDRAR